MSLPSTRVVEAVSEFRGVDSAELPPLYDVLDPDALDALFDSAGSAPTRGSGFVEFVYAGLEVRVDADGTVDVSEPEQHVE